MATPCLGVQGCICSLGPHRPERIDLIGDCGGCLPIGKLLFAAALGTYWVGVCERFTWHSGVEGGGHG